MGDNENVSQSALVPGHNGIWKAPPWAAALKPGNTVSTVHGEDYKPRFPTHPRPAKSRPGNVALESVFSSVSQVILIRNQI